jgi:hypothetical protein
MRIEIHLIIWAMLSLLTVSCGTEPTTNFEVVEDGSFAKLNAEGRSESGDVLGKGQSQSGNLPGHDQKEAKKILASISSNPNSNAAENTPPANVPVEESVDDSAEPVISSTEEMPVEAPSDSTVEMPTEAPEEAPPEPPKTISIASMPVLFGQSGAEYSYTLDIVKNSAEPHTIEILTGPAGLSLNGNTLSWLPMNGNVEELKHEIKLKAYLTAYPDVKAEQDYILTVKSTCMDSVINQVSILRNGPNGEKIKSDLGSFLAYKGDKTAYENYNYYSASAHPIVGPQPKGFFESVFMYIDKDGKSYLNIFWGVDGGGSADTKVDVDIKTSGNAKADSVILSDDSGEMKLKSSTADENNYEGRFQYWSNTDGAVIGPFTTEEYKIEVSVLNGGDNKDAKFYSQDGNDLTLLDGGNLSSFEISFKGVRTCK